MANWDICFNWMMDNEDARRECKIVPDPTSSDPSAQAISGINSAFYPDDFSRIAALPQEQRINGVKIFYYQKFWNDYLAGLNSDEVAKRVLDSEVNEGSGTGLRNLQTAVDSIKGPVISIDGKWGPATTAAADSCPEMDLVNEFKSVRKAHYQNIADKHEAAGNPVDPKILAAWMARAEK